MGQAFISEDRDKVVDDPVVVRTYSERIKLMNWEWDKLIKFHTEKAHWYNEACKHYEFQRSTRYYYHLPGCKYDSTKCLHTAEGKVLRSSEDILEECRWFYKDLYNKPPHLEANDKDLQW